LLYKRAYSELSFETQNKVLAGLSEYDKNCDHHFRSKTGHAQAEKPGKYYNFDGVLSPIFPQRTLLSGFKLVN
jgi:hypothetical protein